MKIAFLSYEYPPETGGGGIGTYLTQMVKYLPSYGHKVVVFCGTKQKEAFWENEFVYRIPCESIQNYNQVLLNFFKPIHKNINFDIAEGTDFGACGIEILRKYPEIPFVTRAHTANYLIDQFLFEPLKGWAKWRFILGGLKRIQIPKLPTLPKEKNFLDEKEIVQNCDMVVSPSHSLAKFYIDLKWCKNYKHLPLLFQVQKEILSIKQNNISNVILNIVFYGRLEVRKGVLEIAKAIPLLLKKNPLLTFYFIGKTANSPIACMDMGEFLKQKLKKFSKSVIFQEAFQPEHISKILDIGDIFLFPSRFDSFGLVCCETMAAGKAVIGSNSGGMAEIIENGISGLLVEPNNPKDIVKKISILLENPELRFKIGVNARKRILNNYSSEIIIPKQIGIYSEVIKNKNGIES